MFLFEENEKKNYKMNFSKIPKSTSRVSFETLHSQFIEWAKKIQKDEHAEKVQADLPEIVVVLQSLGFRICRIDGCNPNEVSPVSGGGQGVRVVVNCGHSGQRFILELEIEPQNCHCVKLGDDNVSEGFWEITATTPSLNQSTSSIETGNNLIPCISKETKLLMKLLMNYFFHMIHETIDFNQNIASSSKDGKEKEEDESSHSLSVTDVAPLATSSAKDLRSSNASVPKTHPKYDSPARYRSLDTLTVKNNAEPDLPEPGTLVKIITPFEENPVVKSSPNIKLASERIPLYEKTNNNEKIIKILKESSALLNRALLMLESSNGKLEDKSDSQEKKKTIKKFFETTLNRRSIIPKPRRSHGSSPLLSRDEANKKQLVTFAPHSSSAVAKPRSLSSSSATSGLTRSESLKSKASSLATKASENPAKPVKRSASLYAHVKSTIPKPDYGKKDSNKK